MSHRGDGGAACVRTRDGNPGKGPRGMSRSIAAITICGIVGGALGLVAGLLVGAGNPFIYAGIGIALGAAFAIPFLARGG